MDTVPWAVFWSLQVQTLSPASGEDEVLIKMASQVSRALSPVRSRLTSCSARSLSSTSLFFSFRELSVVYLFYLL